MKGVLVEDDVQVNEREIVLTEPKSPTKVPESSILAPCPLTSISGVIEDDEEEDDILKDDVNEVYSVHSDNDDDGNDDADQGSSGIKVTEASQEENIDEYLQDYANEEPENAE
ncbi:hypothetical protein Hanom_Chr14g01263371 [Helianthus anomalus]